MAKKGKRGKQNKPPARNHGQWTDDDVFRVIVNPFSAIEIHPHLTVPHEAIVSEDQWIAANARLIRDHGAEAWLRTLLDVLSGDYASSGETPYGYGLRDEDNQDEGFLGCGNAVDADQLDAYVGRLIAERLASHPEALAWPAASPATFYDSMPAELAEEVRQLGGTERLAGLAARRPRWEDLDDGDRRLVVAALIESVMVSPEGEVLADRVEIRWRETPPPMTDETA